VRANLPALLDLLREVLRVPTFPQSNSICWSKKI
jgi:predicted Zn-dependent peptidase